MMPTLVHRIMPQPQRLRALGFALTTACCLLAGCNRGPYDMVRVEGTVLHEDGSPVATESYRMKFVPLEVNTAGDVHPRGATAKVEADGSFRVVTTVQYNDGLIAGKHRVYLPFGLAAGVPAEYSNPSTSPLIVDTAEGRRFELVVPTAN